MFLNQKSGWWAFFSLAISVQCVAQNESGQFKLNSQVPAIENEILAVMDQLGATAATVAVTSRGKLVYSRGFGHSDRRQRRETSTRTTMRLASCTKPVTASAVKLLIERGDLQLDTRVFDYLGISPKGDLADERIKLITIKHLLNHRGGWDRAETFDPMYQLESIRRKMRVSKLEKRHIVQYMWEQPLQFEPNDRFAYSNFGYLLLGLVIEKATDKSYVESIRELIIEPLDGEVALSSPVKGNRESRESFYPEDNQLDYRIRDSASGLVTNAETMCRFMAAYWLDGVPYNSRRRKYFFQMGSHPYTTTTLMEQRLDGVHYCLMFNSRRNEHYAEDNEVIRERFNKILDSVQQQWKK